MPIQMLNVNPSRRHVANSLNVGSDRSATTETNGYSSPRGGLFPAAAIVRAAKKANPTSSRIVSIKRF